MMCSGMLGIPNRGSPAISPASSFPGGGAHPSFGLMRESLHFDHFDGIVLKSSFFDVVTAPVR
jgi:hypothetical protein